jgi:mono/diheme cytochrome c family protein
MNLAKLVLVATAIALVTIGCNRKNSETTTSKTQSPAGSTSATPDQFTASRAFFAKHCAECHGEKAEGKTVEKEGKKLKVPALNSGHALKHPDADFVKQISKGGDGMPAFGEGTPEPPKEKLSAAQIEDMIHFIRHEFQGGMMPPSEPMKPMKGMK